MAGPVEKECAALELGGANGFEVCVRVDFTAAGEPLGSAPAPVCRCWD